jgi:hypothetical protein
VDEHAEKTRFLRCRCNGSSLASFSEPMPEFFAPASSFFLFPRLRVLFDDMDDEFHPFLTSATIPRTLSSRNHQVLMA